MCATTAGLAPIGAPKPPRSRPSCKLPSKGVELTIAAAREGDLFSGPITCARASSQPRICGLPECVVAYTRSRRIHLTGARTPDLGSPPRVIAKHRQGWPGLPNHLSSDALALDDR